MRSKHAGDTVVLTLRNQDEAWRVRTGLYSKALSMRYRGIMRLDVSLLGNKVVVRKEP